MQSSAIPCVVECISRLMNEALTCVVPLRPPASLQLDIIEKDLGLEPSFPVPTLPNLSP